MRTKIRKINIICNTLGGGGIQKVMQDVANYLASMPEKYKVTVTVLESSIKRTELLDSRIKIRGVFRSKASYNRYSPAWIWYVGRRFLYCIRLCLFKHDVVLVLKDGWYFKLGGYLRANKKIAWFHTGSSKRGQEHWTRIFFKSDEDERDCASTYDYIICVTDFGKAQVENQIGKLDNLVVLYNPIDVDAITKKSTPIIDGKDEAHPLFVMVNRLSPEKHVLRVLQCAEILQKNHDFSIWIIGDGEQRKELESYVLNHGIKNITFWGWQENPYPFIAAADWFISASEYETFGLTVHEATALNIPSIVVTLPVIEECSDRKKVFLVDNTFDGLYNGLKKAVDCPKLCDQLKQEKNTYNQKNMYFERLEAIEDLIQ